MNKKISELPVAAALTGEELVPIVQGGVNKIVASTDLKDFCITYMYYAVYLSVNGNVVTIDREFENTLGFDIDWVFNSSAMVLLGTPNIPTALNDNAIIKFQNEKGSVGDGAFINYGVLPGTVAIECPTLPIDANHIFVEIYLYPPPPPIPPPTILSAVLNTDKWSISVVFSEIVVNTGAMGPGWPCAGLFKIFENEVEITQSISLSGVDNDYTIGLADGVGSANPNRLLYIETPNCNITSIRGVKLLQLECPILSLSILSAIVVENLLSIIVTFSEPVMNTQASGWPIADFFIIWQNGSYYGSGQSMIDNLNGTYTVFLGTPLDPIETKAIEYSHAPSGNITSMGGIELIQGIQYPITA